MVDFIIEQFQEQCDAEQANFRGIDDDLDAPLQFCVWFVIAFFAVHGFMDLVF